VLISDMVSGPDIEVPIVLNWQDRRGVVCLGTLLIGLLVLLLGVGGVDRFQPLVAILPQN